MTTEDERAAALDERIRALAAPPLPAAFAARVHARARAALDEGRGAAATRAASFATAAAVVSAAALYLTWAVRFLSALAHG